MKRPVNHAAERKKLLRREYGERRKAIPADEKEKRDRDICRFATALASFRYADAVLMYAPLADEIDVYPIAEKALELGKKVYFPKCKKEDRTMTYYRVTELSQLRPCTYGILEPSEDSEAYFTDSSDSAICFIPAILFDRYGYRVGYGGGYYDRFLPHFNGCKIGVIYSDFILPQVPRGFYDLKVDIMLTERNVKQTLEN
ncbi:MAG: 5-formyltetrahydrofolate cyclo-ligase [Clostridia bacterium]|nr:5-formyltetrahydrofolate cyclo-ligase [Clostridia bacterium]